MPILWIFFVTFLLIKELSNRDLNSLHLQDKICPLCIFDLNPQGWSAPLLSSQLTITEFTCQVVLTFRFCTLQYIILSTSNCARVISLRVFAPLYLRSIVTYYCLIRRSLGLEGDGGQKLGAEDCSWTLLGSEYKGKF